VKLAALPKLHVALVVIAILAFIAASVADPNDQGPSKASYAVAGHVFGIGEEQVFVVRSNTTLTVHYRDAAGNLHSETFRQDVATSVAWTVEGTTASGGPILGIATPSSSSPRSPSQDQQPSPMLDSAGVGSTSGSLGELAAASFLLSSLSSDLPEVGKAWSSDGMLALRYGGLKVTMNNVAIQPFGSGQDFVQIASTGGVDLQGKLTTPGLGFTVLRGKGGATAVSYIEPQNRLLLGMTLMAFSHGSATGKSRGGTYDLNASIATKMVHYVPGVPAFAGAPGFLVASAFVGHTAAADTSLYSTSQPEQVASPAATNTEFIPGPTEAVTPYPSALPEVSLPPIPIPWSSDQPVASPPAPPTPIPTPTRYY
jgi:hypothetical protein